MTDLSNLPHGMPDLPRDTKHNLPIPWNTRRRLNGQPDFKSVDPFRAMQGSLGRLCGICGTRMTGLLAFLGGFSAAEQNIFVDPPMHPECAEQALVLCPHIANRRPILRQTGYAKPDDWYITICRDFDPVEVVVANGATVKGHALKRIVERRRYAYGDDGTLVLAG